MKKLTFKISPSKKNVVNGIVPIAIRLTMDRKSTYLSLGKTYSIPINDWDYKKDIPKRNSNNDLLNHNLKKIGMIVENELLAITSKLNEFSLNEIKECVKIKLSNIDEEVEAIIENKVDEIDFLSYFKKHVERKKDMGKFGTYDNYIKIYSNVSKYLKNKKVPFTHINVAFLEDYEIYLKKVLNNKTNSRHNNFKVIRAVLNKAITDGLLPIDKYPFRVFKPAIEKTNREFLSMDELKKLETLELKEGTTKFNHLKMFLFASYTGLRISDILLLKWKNIVDGKLYFKMRKTESTISIKLIDKAKQILELYSLDNNDLDSFVFPQLSRFYIDFDDTLMLGKRISTSIAYINKNLYSISKQLNLGKKLNFHTSRHTFATLLLNNNSPIQVVQELLGHSKIQTTMIYSHMTSKVMDNEMDRFNNSFL